MSSRDSFESSRDCEEDENYEEKQAGDEIIHFVSKSFLFNQKIISTTALYSRTFMNLITPFLPV